MSIEQVMVQFALAFYGTFAAIAAIFLAVGTLLGVWIGASWQRSRRTGAQVDDSHVLDAWEPAFESYRPGVAKVGDPQ